ncbi:MAG TPA: hypothetical protein VGN83_09280 [Falsiroseomonas sp.]|jgi:hypothetical protein|nr:hypothetical protein [Falsiroseomonas sp.]
MRTARRSLLACLPAALAPAAAHAFRLEEASAETTAEYGASACGQRQLHDQLAAELERGLDGRPLPPGLAPRLAELTRCPFCGCAVAGAPDHGEGEPPSPG